MFVTIQETPPDHRGGYELATRELDIEAGDYDTAVDQARDQLPEGWRILSFRVDR